MTLKELKEELRFNQMGKSLQIAIEARIDFYDSIYSKTVETLSKVKGKYSFETIRQHFNFNKNENWEIHLEFVTGVGLDYSIIVCLNMRGGVDDDKEFGRIIEMMDFRKIPWDTFSDEESDMYCEISERMFYTWLAFIWQEINGFETGLKVSIAEGSAAQFFSLVDFSWDGISDYLEFDESPKRVKKLYEKKLSLIEIYRRTEKEKMKTEANKV